MIGPYKWWTITAYVLMGSSSLAISNWVGYIVHHSLIQYLVFSKIVALSALGPLLFYWIFISLIYTNYDEMNYLRKDDTYYEDNIRILSGGVLLDLIVLVFTYKAILTKYYALKYIESGYCIIDNTVIECP